MQHNQRIPPVKKSCGGFCKAWTCQGAFHKVGGIYREDLKLYHYYKKVNDNEISPGQIQRDAGGQRKEFGQAKRVLILQNISNSDISLGKITNDIDNFNCQCNHCYETLQHISLMLQRLSIIKKNEICGICDHCKQNYNENFYNKCIYCNEVIKSFTNLLHGEKECSQLKQWMKKIRHLPCAMHKGLKHQNSSKSARTLKVGELFQDDFNKTQRAKSANEIETKDSMDDDDELKKSGKFGSTMDPKVTSKKNKSLVNLSKSGEYLTRKATIKQRGKISTQTKKSNKIQALGKDIKRRGQIDGDGKGSKSKYSKTSGQKDGDQDGKTHKFEKDLKRKIKYESEKKKRMEEETDTLKGKTAAFDEMEFQKMKDAKVKEKMKDEKEAKMKGLDEKSLEKTKKIPGEILEDTHTKPEIKATVSEMLLFQARAKEQRDSTSVGKHGVKSTMSKYSEEIARRLGLDTLPGVGNILKLDDDLSAKTSTAEILPQKIKRTHEECFISLDRLPNQLKKQLENIQETLKHPTEKVIVGERIRQFHHNLLSKSDHGKKPLLFQIKEGDTMATGDSNVNEDNGSKKEPNISNNIAQIKTGQPRGIIHYKLSDRQFIDNGWTVLPTEKIVQKMNVYRMKPSRPEYNWFTRNKKRCPMMYDTGEKLAEIDESGSGRWFYRNGLVALQYYSAEEMNAQQRFVVYSPGFDVLFPQKFIPPTVLACFDWSGNGIVYDHSGNIRLKYNQTEGILMDKTLGPVTHWKWHALNDPPVLQQVMIDTQLYQKDPKILEYAEGDYNTQNLYTVDDDEMLAIEYEHFASEKRKKLSQKFMPYQIKSKVVKINDQFSLRVLDQASVHLAFRDGKNSLKLNLGMSLDPREIVDTETTEVGEVTSSYDRLPARTGSLAKIQEMVDNAKKQEKYRSDRQRRIKRPERQLSVDKFRDAVYVPPQVKNSETITR